MHLPLALAVFSELLTFSLVLVFSSPSPAVLQFWATLAAFRYALGDILIMFTQMQMWFFPLQSG